MFGKEWWGGHWTIGLQSRLEFYRERWSYNSLVALDISKWLDSYVNSLLVVFNQVSALLHSPFTRIFSHDHAKMNSLELVPQCHINWSRWTQLSHAELNIQYISYLDICKYLEILGLWPETLSEINTRYRACILIKLILSLEDSICTTTTYHSEGWTSRIIILI